MSHTLVGRERELGELRTALSMSWAGRGQARRVVGEAGIGKSALLEAARSEARDMRVVAARAVEGESTLPFALLSDLVAPLAEDLEEVPRVQRAALEGAVALGPPTFGDRFASYVGFLSLVAAAAAERALLLVVDDVHWADRVSAEALLYVARRIDQDPIAILLSQRSGESEPVLLAEIPAIALCGLGPAVSRALLARTAPGLDEEVAERILDAAGGNPLALTEIPRALSPAQRTGRQALPEPLGAGTRIEELFGRVLERSLSAEARQASAIAALSIGADSEAVRAAARARGLPDDALEEAERAGVLSLRPGRIGFRHPLLRAASATSLAPPEARAAHAALAEVLPARSTERVLHRARAVEGADEALAAELADAGAESMARGAHATAADLLVRAVEVSPSGPDEMARAGQAAQAAFMAGDLAGARRMLERALAFDPPDPIRAQMEGQLAATQYSQADVFTAIAGMRRAAERVEEPTPALAASLYAQAAHYAGDTGGVQLAVELGALAVRAGGLSGDRLVAAMGAGASAHAQLLAGRPTRKAALRAADVLAESAVPGSSEGFLLVVLAMGLSWDGRPRLGRDLVAKLVAAARAAASPSALAVPLVVHGASGWHLGESALGTWELSEGAECARETGQRYALEMALVQRALARARSGDLAGARGDVESAERGRHPPVPIRAFGSQALASADLLEGRHRAVADRLVSIQHEVWDFGMMNPGVLPVGRDLVESLIALGRLREAEEYQRRYAQLAESADSELGRGHALEMRGRLAAARGERFSDAFGDAIAILATVELPYERARARLAIGQELARSGRMREAAEHLDAAAETFADIGADPWVAHAQAGRSAGALRRPRPTPGDGLTPSERRVAELVVDGLTNDDIAGQLFVTRRTVESHLTNVYRKLGIQRRTQLVHALQRGPG